MSYEELERLLKYEEYESKVFMPNEIFDDLQATIKKSSHIAFSYSYIYLVTWLFRNAKSTTSDGKLVGNPKMKELLGYSKDNRTMNYLIKKDGLLEEVGYLKSSKDYPIEARYSNVDGLHFEMLSYVEDYKMLLPNISKRFFFRHPVKSTDSRIILMNSNEGEKELVELEGAYFDIASTHCIPFEVFMYCMSDIPVVRDGINTTESMGTIGFYLYSFLKRRGDMFPKGYTASIEKISNETLLSERTVVKYIGLMKELNMLEFWHNMSHFIPGIAVEERKGNSYKIKEFGEFTYNEKIEKYQKIGYMTLEQHEERKKELNDIKKSIDENLPF